MKPTIGTMRKTALYAVVLVGTAMLTAGMMTGARVFGARDEQALASANQLSDAFAQTAEEVTPGVVFIQVEKEMGQRSLRGFGPDGTWPMDPFEFFFGPRGQMPEPQERNRGMVPYGQGSGFIISSDGYILTNNHVVGDADRVKVTLSDGREMEAKIIGSDPQTEVALVKVEAKGLPALKLGDSDRIRVGEWVLAVGNPFGLSHSVTSGIVSAQGRGDVGIVDYADFIQTDAAINPGNSGGPLVNLKGEVIGMNTAIVSRTGGSMGIGFAIPVNMIKYVEKQLRDKGTVDRGFLGVVIQNLTPDLSKWFDIQRGKGVLISGVSEGSPAEKAGLQRDDIIVEFNGQPVEEAGSFRSRVSTTPPGEKVDIVVLRNGKREKIRVEIGTLPEDKGRTASAKPGMPAGIVGAGLTVQNLTDDLAERLGFKGLSGVVVSDVESGSAAEAAGIKPGMLIQEVNRRQIHNTQEFKEALKADKSAQGALLLVRDGEFSRYVALDIEK